MRWFRIHRLQALTHVAALLPLAVIVWDFTQDRLTANPIQEITLRTGTYSLILLVLALAGTPVKAMFGIKSVLRLRRPLGLYAFMYASLHSLNFVGLDYGFDFTLLREDVFGKSFAWVGLAAFLCLLPLAITSTQGWKIRLGKNWERLHWFIYLAVLLTLLHFVLLVKADFSRPLLYGIIVAVLLVARFPAIRKAVSGFRGQLARKGRKLF